MCLGPDMSTQATLQRRPKSLLYTQLPYSAHLKTTGLGGKREGKSEASLLGGIRCSQLLKQGYCCSFQVRVYDLSRYEHGADDVLILATDGLWDVLSNEEVAEAVTQFLPNCDPDDPHRFVHFYDWRVVPQAVFHVTEINNNLALFIIHSDIDGLVTKLQKGLHFLLEVLSQPNKNPP